MDNPVFYNRLTRILRKRKELLYKLAEKDIIFVPIEDIVEINRIIMLEHKGIHGVRDSNLLESAASSIINKYEYEGEKDKGKLGIILMERLIKNHPFIDGNKRTAIVAMEMFLDANLIELEMNNDWLYKIAYMVAKNEITIDRIFQKLITKEPLPTKYSIDAPRL
jgi:death-on-curing protein